jgi:hypothetical protein
MSITREGKFLVTRTLQPWPVLGLESCMLDACVDEAASAGYAGVFGSPVFGFQEQTLDCLLSLPELKSVWFWDIELEDIDAVYSLKSLQSFGIHPRRPAVDFSRLPTLKRIVIEPRTKDRGLEALSLLEMLHLWHYAPKSKTFHGLPVPSRLVELQVNWANPKSLQGLPLLPCLKRFEIHRCRNLESISDLPELFPHLEHLVVTACGRVDPAQASRLRSQLPRLKHAFVQGVKVV